ncbi:MAG: pantoate--beta-alanine ligase, partial [Nitrospirae bacterium]|nr:pantoate--beta-alanine ligase [Nitrospirota bacterium]
LEVVFCPTVREPDGLSMSSRNAFFNQEERQAAAVLYRALKGAEETYRSGEVRATYLQNVLRRVLESEALAAIEYIQVVHPETLQETEEAREGTILALAVKIGKTRLIDNWRL